MITIDASIVVKWFKKNERFYSEAVHLRNKIINLEVRCCSSEWLSLEVTRGLKRNQSALDISDKEIDDMYYGIEDLFSIEVLLSVPVSQVKSLTAKFINELNLYASDSLYLATAIHTNSGFLITDDDHLLKKSVQSFAKEYGVNVVTLDGFKIEEG